MSLGKSQVLEIASLNHERIERNQMCQEHLDLDIPNHLAICSPMTVDRRCAIRTTEQLPWTECTKSSKAFWTFPSFSASLGGGFMSMFFSEKNTKKNTHCVTTFLLLHSSANSLAQKNDLQKTSAKDTNKNHTTKVRVQRWPHKLPISDRVVGFLHGEKGNLSFWGHRNVGPWESPLNKVCKGSCGFSDVRKTLCLKKKSE